MIQTIKRETVKKVFYKDFKQLNLSLVEWGNDYNMNREQEAQVFKIPDTLPEDDKILLLA